MKKLELLAPGKNVESAIIAIKCGADAVYIGANKFGARASAGNSIGDIEKIIQFARKYRTKVYATINTILDDREIPEAQKLIHKLYEVGADAVIIQDMGLLELDLPPIPLFASTQAHNTNWQKVEFLEKVGFQRVILARELSLEQIKEIKTKTNIDLEFFVHGALCVCYSGQCYLSQAIGGRSGNRGVCAQPCRKKYSLRDSGGKVIAKDKYLLSLKDLNLSHSLKDLINAGITSFKIEGRLKDINYVKNIVSFYRQKLDEIIEGAEYTKSSSGKSFINFSPAPDKTFNRGYTDYFLNRRKKGIACFDTPKFVGEPLGKIIKVNRDHFIIDSKAKLSNGDGISFFAQDKKLQGTVVNRFENGKIYPNSMKQVQKGLLIYRNLDHEFLKNLNSSKLERKIGLDIRFYESGEFLILELIDEDGIKVENCVKKEFELAQNQQKSLESIEKQLKKLGETDFYPQKIEIETDQVYFIPVSILNEVRRKTVEKLVKKRREGYSKNLFKIEHNDFPYPEKNLDYTANILNSYAEKFYLRHGVENIEPAAESGIKLAGEKVMTTKHCLRYEFDLCRKKSKNKALAEPLYIIDEYNKEYLLEFDCQNCEMNIIY